VSRHYYDLHCLLGSETGKAALGDLDLGAVQRDNQVDTRIASPRSAPEQLCRCLTWMFLVVATRHSVIAWKAAADEVVPNTIS
jgi:hypothetical protein